MVDRSVPITPTGLAALQAELAGLRAKRPAIVSRVASARSDGDLKENFAYHDARQELGMLDGRAQTLEALIANAVVIGESDSSGGISLGAKVVVRDEFGESTYTLVGPAEADVVRGMISLESPLGSALMGRSVGDTISFDSPGGRRSAEVVAVG